MTYKIEEMTAFETQLVSGGVIMSPDGSTCTEPRGTHKPIVSTEQGGPLAVELAEAV